MRYEYKTYKHKAGGFMGGKFDEVKMDQEMNELGAQGWEMVTSLDTNEGYGATRYIVVLFKRPKS